MRAKTSLWIGSAVSALAALPVAAAATAAIAIWSTIYANGTALIQDHRSINVTGGRQRLEFQNVSARIQPETVSLAAEGISIVEQNFDFDLLTPGENDGKGRRPGSDAGAHQSRHRRGDARESARAGHQ